MDDVFDALDFIRKPLDAVSKVLEPIEPLLSAVDFVASLTVDPVIEFVLDNLGIDQVIDAAEAKVRALLPDADALDGFDGVFNAMEEALARYDPLTTLRTYDHDRSDTTDERADPFGLGEWVVENLQAKLMEAAVETINGTILNTKIGELSAEGIGVAIEIPDGVRGADDDDLLYAEIDPDGPDNGVNPIADIHDLLMIGDDKDNTIKATGGVNVLYGAGGDDLLIGSDDPDPDAEDIAVFSGTIDQYRFSRSDLESPVIMEHVSPIPGQSLDGRDTLIGIEKVTFLGGSTGTALTLSVDDLFDQVEAVDAGGTVNRSQEGDANGDGEIDSVFLFGRDTIPPATTQTVLVGGAGDDLISGTTGNDLLVGGRGDDDFRIRGGVDVVNGGGGSDTLSLFDDNGVSNSNVYIDLKDREFVVSGTFEATLISIENVLIDDERNIFVFGDAKNNILTTAGRQDLVFGGRGSDTIFGRGDADILIGGIGSDQVYGGDGGDYLFAGDRALRSASDFYDGEEGKDTLSYSGDNQSVFNQQFIEDAKNSVTDIQQTQAYLSQNNSRSVIVYAGDGRVERLNREGGIVVSVDTFQNIENFHGSDFADILYGGLGENSIVSDLLGGAGNDVIHAELASGSIDGGAGNDLIIADVDRSAAYGFASAGVNYIGGGGVDTLDLTKNDDMRWEVVDTNADEGGDAGLWYYLASESETSSATSSSKLSLDGFEHYIGSINADLFHLSQDAAVTVESGDGNDFIKVEYDSSNSHYTIDAGLGDDLIEMWGDGTVDGGAGEDEIRVYLTQSGDSVDVDGGAGNDIVFIRSGRGHLDGGEERDDDGNLIIDNDILSAFVTNDARFGTTFSPYGGLNVNLMTGTVSELSGNDVNFTIANFETIIGSDLHGDILGGGTADDRLIGAGGNDILEGRAGLHENPNLKTFFQIPVDGSLTFSGSWTLEAVVSTNKDDSDYQRIVSKPVDGTQTFSLAVHEGQAHVRFDSASVGARFVEAGFVADGENHHIVGRYDAVTQMLSLFVDQVKVGEISVAGAVPRTISGPVSVGNFSEERNTQPFAGDITGVRVWSVARSDDEVMQPYSAVNQPQTEDNLEIALRIRGDIAQDLSANAYDIDVIDWSSGNDLLYGGAGYDRIYGGDGDDFLHPGGGSGDSLYGGHGNDTASFAFGAPGADRAQAEFAFASHDYDNVHADLALGVAYQSGPEDKITYLDSIENLVGTSLDDILRGDHQDNSLSGALGADLIEGRGGNDTIAILGDDTADGGDGDDYFSLGFGNATIIGGEGEDTLAFDETGIVLYDLALNQYRSEFAVQVPVWADGGTEIRFVENTTVGYTPQDVLETDPAYANSLDDAGRIIPDDPQFQIVLETEIRQYSGSFTGIETLIGGTAVTFIATPGDDLMMGLSAADTLNGALGNDTLIGGGGADNLLGGQGDDTLEGGAGSDILNGGDGDDVIDPGAGDDEIQFARGEAGNDTYRIGSDAGRVVIDIRAEAFGGGTDTVILTDLLVDDIMVETRQTTSANGRFLEITWDSGTEAGVISVAQLGRFVETFEFADGTIMTSDELLLL